MPYIFARRAAVFTEPVVARIKELAGQKSARDIAKELNLSRGSLHQWAQARRISLAVKREPAVSESAAAIIRRLAGKVLGPVIAKQAGISYGVGRRAWHFLAAGPVGDDMG